MKSKRWTLVAALALCAAPLGAPFAMGGEARVVQFRVEDARGGRTLTLDAAEGLGRAEAWAAFEAAMRQRDNMWKMAATEFGQVLDRNKAAQREWDDAFSFPKDSPGQKRHLQNLIETVHEDAGTSLPLGNGCGRAWDKSGKKAGRCSKMRGIDRPAGRSPACIF